jgi:hypothetical protein
MQIRNLDDGYLQSDETPHLAYYKRALRHRNDQRRCFGRNAISFPPAAGQDKRGAWRAGVVGSVRVVSGGSRVSLDGGALFLDGLQLELEGGGAGLSRVTRAAHDIVRLTIVNAGVPEDCLSSSCCSICGS